MNAADFMDALQEAVIPRCRRNRRRIHNATALRLLKVIAAISCFLWSIPGFCRAIFRSVVPTPQDRRQFAKLRRHPARHVRHRRGGKIIRIDDSHLMRVEIY